MTNSTSPTERVGRYQLLEPIGIGPSGSVSRAKVFGVAGFERQFAVKRFHAELTATAAMAAMLSAAARAYGSLEHPRIARMSEFGVAQGSTFTAVEYVLGLDALRLISEAKLAGVTLAAGGALALVSQAARAVGYAHGRGLTHLGLAPTNVIVTAEGDIKITDFGILSATLPPRPIEVPRLAQRIPYLAPEQLANEATSAATDVFALGVLAYELVTGNRTFKGETPQQVASAIMAGPPNEPLLPRPIVRVLQRCLARSPFERFPDARALADALDAALRVAPVPGTRKDIGAQVKETLDRFAALNEGQMSGMVALHVGTGPIRRPDEPELGQDPGPTDAPAYELGRPEITAGGPQTGPGSTFQDIPRSPMTMPGVAPPPIPVPPGVSGVPLPAPPSQSGAHTLLGMGKAPVLPPIRPLPRPGSASGLPVRPPAVPQAALRPTGRAGTDLAIPIDPPKERDSAIHPLDPDDLVPFDGGTGDLGEADTVAESAGASRLNAPGASPEPARSAVSSSEPRPGEASGGAAPAEFAGPPRLSGPGALLRDTRPIPHEALAPLLFDPIERSPEPDEAADGDPASADDGDHAANGSERSDEEPAAPTAAESAAPRPEAAATLGSGPAAALGKTMLGFAAAPTPRPPANTPRTPMPPVEPPGDEMSGMLLEGFHAAPPGTGPLPASAEPAGPPENSPQLLSYPPGDPQQPMYPGDPQQPMYPGDPQQPMYPGDPQQPMYPGDPQQPMYSHGDPQQPMGYPPGEPQAMGYPPGEPQQPMGYPPGDPQAMAFPPPGSEPQLPPQLAMSQPPPAPQQGWVGTPALGVPTASAPSAARPQRRIVWILVGMIGAVVVAIGAWQIYSNANAPSAGPGSGSAPVAASPSDARAVAAGPDASQVAAATPDAVEAAATPDAAQVAAATPDAAQVAAAIPDAAQVAAANPDAAQVAAATPDAGTTAPADAAQVAVAPVGRPPGTTPSPGGDTLSIASTPPGARVFLDGSDTGATPVTLPGSPDRHNIALLLAGHELYVAQVDGHGTFQIPLKEVTPTNGPAGIKVLRCKDKDRYYVSVDGKHTGQTCPTERIGCELGPHTVEVYDVVSETRRKWDIVVKDTRLSFRIRVE